jgi:hypothetical protein
MDYGWDFGVPPSGWTGGQEQEQFRASRRARIAADLRRLAGEGFSVVRWFVLADGLGLPAEWEDEAIRPLVSDFEALLAQCEQAGVRLLPSLLDFHWCLPAVTVGPGMLKRGRARVIRDPERRRSFLDQVLNPLLDVSRPRRASIFAWEVMNEPEWVTRERTWRFWEGLFPGRRAVPLSAMQAFLREAVQSINAAGFVSTIGWAHWRTIRGWKTEGWGIGLQQFHYYGQARRPLPPAGAVCSGPCLVGEFAAAPAPAWPDGARNLEERLRRIEDAGYAGALVWSLNATDPFSRGG